MKPFDQVIAETVCEFAGTPFDGQPRANKERRLQEAGEILRALEAAGYNDLPRKLHRRVQKMEGPTQSELHKLRAQVKFMVEDRSHRIEWLMGRVYELENANTLHWLWHIGTVALFAAVLFYGGR